MTTCFKRLFHDTNIARSHLYARTGKQNRTLDNLEKLCEGGRTEEALEIIEQQWLHVSRNNAYCILQNCMRNQNQKDATRVQSLMLQNGLELVIVLVDHLIRLFGSCGCWIEANHAFKMVIRPSVYTWIAIISAHANLGQTDSAMDLYHSMQLLGIHNDKYIYLAILKACRVTAVLSKATLVHACVILTGLQDDIFMGSTLVDTYAKCGSLEESCRVFSAMVNPNVVSWGAILDGFAQHDGYLALNCFHGMQREGVKPNGVIFLSVLKACSNIGSLETSRYIHENIIYRELHFDIFVGNMLLDIYAKCGSLREACKVFGSLVNRNVVTWNAIITAHVREMDGLVALDYFEKMNQEGILPNKVTFSSILKACQDIGHIRNIHEQIIGSGLEVDTVVGNSLVDSYSRNEKMDEAHKVFNKLPNKDLISWGTIITGYAQHEEGFLALKCFEDMELEGMQSNEVTFSSILKACGSLGAIEHGRCIHAKLLSAETKLDIVLGNAIVDMYGKCGNVEEAHEAFDRLSNQDLVLWGTIISAYAQHDGLISLQCFDYMRNERIEPDKVIFSSIIKACGNIGALARGRHIHDEIIENGLQLDLIVGSALVDMYAKCGSVVEAEQSFSRLPTRDVICWGAMIAGYAQLGHVGLAVQCFESMQNSGLEPNDIIYISILNACCHVGLVDEGRIYFKSMIEDHKIRPELFHRNCMIELLSNAGWLKEAGALLQNTSKRNIHGWTGMLNACSIYGDSELARHCFDVIANLGSECAGGYVLMSNICANAGLAKNIC